MQINMRFATWNANGASNHTKEIEIFLKSNYLDILMISETHFTAKTFFKIKNYEIVQANHPDGKAHAGSAILVKSSIKFEILTPITMPSIQASGIKVKCDNFDVCIYAVYFPPRHSLTCTDYDNFFKLLGPRFIIGGDFNAKHTWWGSRLINPKGSQLYKSIQKNKYKTLSIGRPTYWPSDPTKILDLLDFFVYSGLPSHLLDITDSDDLSSDHTPIIACCNTALQNVLKNTNIFNSRTDINSFQHFMDENIQLNTSIKTIDELNTAVENFTNLIHEAAFLSTPQSFTHNGNNVVISAEIREMIRNKRRLRRIWQQSRNVADKTNYNQTTKHL